MGPGLGAALARRFGREGFALTLIARSEPNLTGTADALRGEGMTVDTVVADASAADGFRAAHCAPSTKQPPARRTLDRGPESGMGWLRRAARVRRLPRRVGKLGRRGRCSRFACGVVAGSKLVMAGPDLKVLVPNSAN